MEKPAVANKMEKVRFNLELPAPLKTDLDELVVSTNAASLSEVIRRALALFALAMQFQKAGGHLCLENPDGTRERLTIL